jgi:hypothetical protein
VVPRCDLVGPALQCPAELTDLRWGLVLEVGCEPGYPRQGGVGIAGQIDVTYALLSVNRP